MVLKWIKSVTSGAIQAEAARRADDEERKIRKESKLVDVAHEAMNEKAAEDRAMLEGLIRMGWPNVQREKFKSKVRRKVWEVVGEAGNVFDPEMIDEVTERIVDCAEADPFYKKMFEKKEV